MQAASSAFKSPSSQVSPASMMPLPHTDGGSPVDDDVSSVSPAFVVSVVLVVDVVVVAGSVVVVAGSVAVVGGPEV